MPPGASPPPVPADRRVDARTDVLVVGGGINGAGIARDLAGRGWRVWLVERGDLAGATSSASTKLVHGGLRYLEQRQFALVRKALREREVLLRSAPHLIRPQRFVLPHDAAMRPAWLVRAGLFLYDHLAPRDVLGASHGVDLTTHPAGAALQPRFTRGFVYADGWADDARLVVAAALDARERGATVRTRTACVAAQRQADGWVVTLRDAEGAPTTLHARALVNATGPWADAFLRDVVRSTTGPASRHLRLVKGSHVVVPRRFAHDDAYLFQGSDRRVLFAIPYEGDFTLIGTTDVEITGDPGAARVDAAEVDYLCAQASRYLRQPVTPADVVWRFCGVRPLLDDAHGDPSAVTRDYRLETDAHGGAPLLTVWGGKLTTFRVLAEEASSLVGRLLGDARTPWTAAACLPGGDLSAFVGAAQRPDTDFARFVDAVRRRWPWLPPALALRLARAYGSRIERVLGGATSLAALGAELAPGLHEAELAYLRREEWAVDADDVLWRRSKIGLHASAAQRAAVAQAMHAVAGAAVAA